MVLQHTKNCARLILGIDRLFHRHVRSYRTEEFIARAYLLRFSGRTPSFVIDPPDQHRELVTQLGCLVDCQTITEDVKDCAQHLVGAVPIEP